jgi:hypothetical protein
VPSGTTRRGTSSACARRTHSSRKTPNKRLHFEDTSFARSRDPCTSTITHPEGVKALEGCERWTVESVSRSGKPAQAGGTGTGVGSNGRKRGSPRVTASGQLEGRA